MIKGEWSGMTEKEWSDIVRGDDIYVTPPARH